MYEFSVRIATGTYVLKVGTRLLVPSMSIIIILMKSCK